MSALAVVEGCTLKGTPALDSVTVILTASTNKVKCQGKKALGLIQFLASKDGYTPTTGVFNGSSQKVKSLNTSLVMADQTVSVTLKSKTEPPIPPNTSAYVSTISIDDAGQDKVKIT